MPPHLDTRLKIEEVTLGRWKPLSASFKSEPPFDAGNPV
jgi:hypothetical protein